VNYGEIVFDSDHAVERMARASCEAERAWRFRHVRTPVARFFAAITARARGFLTKVRGRALRTEQEQVPSTRQELAY